MHLYMKKYYYNYHNSIVVYIFNFLNLCKNCLYTTTATTTVEWLLVSVIPYTGVGNSSK